MKSLLSMSLAVLMSASTATAAPDHQAMVVTSHPQDRASPLVLALADGTQCQLSGNLYRERRRSESDILPRSEWVVDLSRKSCPHASGSIVTRVQWEMRLSQAPRHGDLLAVPGRL